MLPPVDARTGKTRRPQRAPRRTGDGRGARACRKHYRQARPAARVADADRRHRPDRRTAVRAPRRRRILHAGDRRAGGRDRAGAVARMVRAPRRALAARGRALRHHLPRRWRCSRSGRSSFRRPTGSRWCRTGSPKVRAALEPVLELYKNLDRFIDRTSSQIAITPGAGRTVRIETPNSMLRPAGHARRRTC